MSLSPTIPAEILQPDDNFTLRLARKPEAIVAEATLCANALIGAVRKNGWMQKFGNKEHLFFEAWSFLATMYRVTPRVRETRLVQIGEVIGYEAFAEAFHVPTGTIIATADAMCLDDEENWDMRAKYEWQGPQGNRQKVQVGTIPVPLFQLRSMAQTRAMAKALKAPFSWIVAMAGYAPRAAEDIGPAETGEDEPPGPRQPQRKPAAASSPLSLISERQMSRLYALAHQAGKDKDEVVRILKHYGFDSAKDITIEKYEPICAEIQKGDSQ